MRFFLRYLRCRIPVLLVFVICTVIFIAAFGLYGVPVKAAVYPGCVALIFLIIVGVIDYILAYRKHRALLGLRDSIEEIDLRSQGLFDEDNLMLINELRERLSALRTGSISREADLTDYYTKWVHQIKLPIAAMKLTLDGEDSELSRSLSDELFRINQYVEMVLTYLRLGSESSDYVFREYELDSIIRGEIKKFAGQFIRRGIRLEFRASGKRVTTDEKWLGFVIGQILSNALKYTRSGSISICVEEPLELVIRDTGIGIAAQDVPRVFERGYTGINGRGEASSSGLGLWLCKCVCDKLGNTIELESEVGRGTTVRIWLGKDSGRFE